LSEGWQWDVDKSEILCDDSENKIEMKRKGK
jgi:hypothetical protein